jgi:hypothetical protein
MNMKPNSTFVGQTILRPAVFACFVLLAASAHAQFTYVTNNGAITITGYTGSGGNVAIPDTINGLPVTSIGDWAFSSGGVRLTNVTIPDSVTSIGEDAFIGCLNLTNVTIPDSVTSIGDEAFDECGGLRNVTIGNRVADIGESAFANCTSLVSVTIPDSVTNIGEDAFGSCESLTNVTIPDSITSIGVDAFSWCVSLPNVIIPNSVTDIGAGAFAECICLTSVTIPDGVTNIGDFAFSGCMRLAKAFFQGNAPSVDGSAGSADTSVFASEAGTLYYVPGTAGWGRRFGGWPTAPWYQPTPQILGNACGLGVQSNGFGFTVSWATNTSVVVQTCTNWANPVWTPVATNALTNGVYTFSDPQWTNYPSRFYRVRSP